MFFQGRIFAVLFLLYQPYSQASQSLRGPEIRVKLAQVKQFSLHGYNIKINGKYKYNGYRSFNIRCDKKGIYVRKKGPFVGPITFKSPKSVLFFNKRTFHNQITIHAQANKCLVVNKLGIEKYLMGLINKEMPASWPMEAFKAQAVAARSYAIYKAKTRKHHLFDLESDVRDQMYRGASGENTRSRIAVRTTHGQILKAKQKILMAYYHANCGGKTELPNMVWGNGTQSNFYKRVSCPGHLVANNQKKWRHKVNVAQLEHSLQKYAESLPKGFKLASLNISGKYGKRVNSIRALSKKGKYYKFPANKLRQALGSNQLKSTVFKMKKGKNSIHFYGNGHGHGVGMCQVGAKVMSENGVKYRMILKHYYPLASLQRMY